LSKITVGIIDYGMGNHASVLHSLRDIGFRVRVTDEIEVLDNVDIMILPGVGAFPSAMQALHKKNLVNYIRKQAQHRRPIIGICLGMQLLAYASYEYKYTVGLELIPGEFVPLNKGKWHIGWNTLECIKSDSVMMNSDGQDFYFNHSYVFHGPSEFQICLTRHPNPIVSVIQRGNVIGMQFHPEKSQNSGKTLLKNVITDLCYA